MDSSDDEQQQQPEEDQQEAPNRFVWTDALKQSFREELEKLVILDYIMRNTDRGLDNWMVKVDWETGTVSLASDPIRLNLDTPDDSEQPRPVDISSLPSTPSKVSHPYAKQRPMQASSASRSKSKQPEMSLGAIDNSLSWPWKHPDAWRR